MAYGDRIFFQQELIDGNATDVKTLTANKPQVDIAVDDITIIVNSEGKLSGASEVQIDNRTIVKNSSNKLSVPIDGLTIIVNSEGKIKATVDLTEYSKISETGSIIDLSIDSEYKLVATLYDKNNILISTSTVIDLPIEESIVDISINSEGTILTFTLRNGRQVQVPLTAIIKGLATQQWVKDNYLPLVGGTMTGGLTLKNGTSDAGIYGDDEGKALYINSNPKGITNGSYIAMFGKNNSNGAVYIKASNGTESSELSLQSNGELKWNDNDILTSASVVNNLTSTSTTAPLSAYQGKVLNDTKQDKLTAGDAIDLTSNVASVKYDDSSIKLNSEGKLYAVADTDEYLPLAGGTMTGTISTTNSNALRGTSDSQILTVGAGASSSQGAELSLYGSHTSESGIFKLTASNGSTSKSLEGFANSKLLWDNQAISTFYNSGASTTTTLLALASNFPEEGTYSSFARISDSGIAGVWFIQLTKYSDDYFKAVLSSANNEVSYVATYSSGTLTYQKLGSELTAGTNIDITNNVISATDTTYEIATSSTAGLVKSATTGTTTGKDYNVEVNADGTMKVNVPWTDSTYSAGENIAISWDRTISAKDTTYTAGDGLALSGTTFSNSGVREITQDSTDGHKLTINTNGTSSTITIPDNDTTYTAGSNVQISSGNVISATDTTYTAGTNVQINGTTISATDTKYTAGNNVQINASNEISATDTTYSAGTGISLSGTTFSNSGILEVTQDSTDGHKLNINKNGTTSTITIPDNDTTYTAGTNVQINSSNVISATDTTYEIATSSKSGLVKSSTTGTVSGRDYNVEVNSDGTMKVNVPWTDEGKTYTAGNNIQISSSNVISATDTTYSAGTNIQISGNTISATDTKYTAGSNVQISGTTISATDTTYSAGTGISLSGTEFSNSGVREVTQDSTDGHKLNINTNGTTATITIPDNDTTYTAGSAINVDSNNKINVLYDNSTIVLDADGKLKSVASGTMTAGTGLSISGTTINHSNSVTAQTTQKLGTVAYDAQGHITGFTEKAVVNNLTSTATDQPLSAYQGKVLNEKFNNYLPLSGGTMSGILYGKSGFDGGFEGNDSSKPFMIRANPDDSTGSYICLGGRNWSDGAIYIKVSNGSSSSELALKADGTLTWNGKTVVTS